MDAQLAGEEHHVAAPVACRRREELPRAQLLVARPRRYGLADPQSCGRQRFEYYELATFCKKNSTFQQLA